jgi:hypothetical protein
MQHHTETAPPDHFPTDTTGLPACRRPEIVELADGAALDLEIAPVAKQLGDATVRMLSYNGSIPGPTLKVAQGSEVDVNVINQGDLEATVHWHGWKEERLRRGGRPVCMVVVTRLWHASALAAHLWCGVVCRPRALR